MLINILHKDPNHINEKEDTVTATVRLFKIYIATFSSQEVINDFEISLILYNIKEAVRVSSFEGEAFEIIVKRLDYF